MQETKSILDILASLPPGCWGVLATAALGGGWVFNLRRHRESTGGGPFWGAPSRVDGAASIENLPDAGRVSDGRVVDRHVAKALAVLKDQFVSDGVKTVRDPGLAVRLAEEELSVWFEDGDSPYSG